MKKNIIIPAVALTIIAGSLYAANNVSAFGYSRGGGQIVQRLAEKLGKSEEEIQAVIEEMHEEHWTERGAEISQQLDEAVATGTITQEQKQLILNKHEEMKQEREEHFEEMRNLSPEERRTEMQEHHDEMQTWAEENGINLQALQLGIRGPHRGMHGFVN